MKTLADDYRPHDPKADRINPKWQAAVRQATERQVAEFGDATGKPQKVLGLNSFGRPEGLVVYGNDPTTQLEFAVDLDLKKVTDPVSGQEVIDVVGMQMLCPKCQHAIYLRGKGLPNGQEIVAHWDEMTQSGADGKWRPLVSVDGWFGCDYTDAEISGVSKSRASHVVAKCNWKGGVHRGVCRDHTIQLVRGT